MAVAATELRPRGAIGIVDGAVRLVSRSGDLWALALPGGALAAAAVTWLAQAISSGRGVMLASLLMTLAWFARSLFQGAAAHFAESTLVDTTPVSVRGALRAAVRHAPTLFITTAMVLALNLASMTFTFGLAVFFLSAHVASYAVAMKDAGHPLNLYATCSRVLGPARASTPGVRVALWLVILLALNLHIATNALLLIGRKLLGFDLVFLDRYCSIDNPVWVVAVCAGAFAVTDPLRAAVGALLVVDGRVRQNGVDLQSGIAQLPRRRGRTAAALVAAVVGFLSPRPAQAQGAELVARLGEVIEYCDGYEPSQEEQLLRLREVGPKEAAALSRFVREVEQLIEEEDDCERALSRTNSGLAMSVEALDALAARELADPSEKAREILSRPEFAEAPPKQPPAPRAEEPETPEEEGAFERFWKWLREVLKKWMERGPVERAPSSLGSAGGTFAWIVVVVLGLGVVGVILWLVFRGAHRERQDLSGLEVTSSTPGEASSAGEGALARPPETWSSMADALAQEGQFKEAIRHLYLAVLSRLHGLGAIDYDPGLSNWDYLRRFRGALGFKDDFRELTFRFDYAFYGNEPLTREAYARFRARAAGILATGTDRPEAANA